MDISECHDGQEAVLKNISFIKSQVDASKDIANLEKSLEKIKLMTASNIKEVKEIDADREEVVRNCRNIEEITQISEFKYVEHKDATMVCQVCDTKFKYPGNLEPTFLEKKISPQFSHLKKVLKVRMKTEKHQMKLKKALNDGLGEGRVKEQCCWIVHFKDCILPPLQYLKKNLLNRPLWCYNCVI